MQRLGRNTNRIAVWALAVVLPILCSVVTSRVHILRQTPFALHVLTVIFVSMLGGLGPAAVAIVSAVFSNYSALNGFHRISDPFEISVLRSSILVVIGVFVSLMERSRRRALAALQERTDELILSQQGSRCASWHYDPRIGMRWQRGGFEVFGIPFDELEKHPVPVALIHPEDREEVQKTVAKMVATRGPLLIEYRVIFPNGDIHWNEARGTLIPGRHPSWRGVTFDITASKIAENALLQSEKLAAMGRLASTVAHEINNPLEAVTNLLYLARTEPSQSEASKTYLATAEAELGRLSDITRLTLGFVRSNSSPRNVDPVETVNEVLAIFRHRLETKKIRVDQSHQPGLAIYIAPHELRQIVTNLISNASDAVAGPGARLSIQIVCENDSVILVIEDNGSGIDAVDFERIFEPFFSTKHDVGTGIGLWVTRELVEKNGGVISVRSGELSGGMKTSFRVEFPAAGPEDLSAIPGSPLHETAVRMDSFTSGT